MTQTSAWADAARRLARSVTRRERAGALLGALGMGTLLGTAVAWLGGWLLPLLPIPDLSGWALPAWVAVGAGALWGGWRGLRAARAVPPADLGSAAWALDRLAGAGEAGLAAALHGTASAVPPPPPARLRAVAGLPLALGAALAAGLVLLWDARRHAAAEADSTALAASALEPSTALPGEAGPLEADASGMREQRAAEAERVRLALGLAPRAEATPALLAERLEEPRARQAALEAADRGSELARALAAAAALPAAGPAADDLARGLTQASREATTLEAERRAALAAASLTGRAPLPASRRALVERHAALLRREGAR